MKRFALALADLLAVVWQLLPRRLRHLFLKGLFVLESRGRDTGAGLARLFSIQDDLEHVVNERALVHGRGEHPKHRLMRYHNFFVERIASGERVLDVGCGYGAVARSIARERPDTQVVGVDYDKGRLAQARAADNPPNLAFVETDATRALPEGPWDVVVLSNVLEHISDRVGFLSSLIGKTGAGRFLIRVPLFERDWKLPMRREVGANYYSDPDHKIEPKLSEFRAETSAAGLAIDELLTPWGEILGLAAPGREGVAMMLPSISVIVPCYNGGRYLDALLASLAAQSFRDFEIVIVDDGSTEEATRAKLTALDPEIRVVRQENRGLAGARNTGFREARANLILPLDCDDQLDLSFLAEAHAAISAAPTDAGFVFTHARLTGARAGVRACHFDRFDQLFVNDLPYAMLIRKSAWQSVGGYDESMRDGYEDWEFNIRLVASGFGAVEVPKPLLIYNVSPTGMLATTSLPRHGTLWRRIRDKHRNLFRPAELLSQWRTRDKGAGRISLATGTSLLLLAIILPEVWFGRLFHRALMTSRWWKARRRDMITN